ncbi:MAG: RNA polymerase subunit sigma-24 [Candidatus Roseilinea sp.]|nr:MAG: RNA polymerase subunit sigma-24 [Candidatus Roseilinea sp.]
MTDCGCTVQPSRALSVDLCDMLTLAIERTAVTLNIRPNPAADEPVASGAFALSEADRERACVRDALAGDADAFRPLVEAYQVKVYNLALRMLGNEREAEDAAQDAFLQAYARLATYKPEWRFKTWLMTIASNLCIDRLRRRRLESIAFADVVQREEGNDEIEFTSRDPQPDAVVARQQRDEVIRAMLLELPAEDRSMVVMFYFNDMSYEEIAQAMHTTVSAVKARLFRARQKMARSKWVEKL